MLVEIAKPVAFIICILSLFALFHTAFLVRANDLEQTIYDSLGMLALAAGVSLASGLMFREATPGPHASSVRLSSTLPVQMFCWASGIMLVLFVISWYLQTHCVFYRDIRIWV